MNLPTLCVQSGAVITEAVIVGARSPLVSRYIASRRARAIVMVNTVCRWLADFINGIKVGNGWHRKTPFAAAIIVLPVCKTT